MSLVRRENLEFGIEATFVGPRTVARRGWHLLLALGVVAAVGLIGSAGASAYNGLPNDLTGYEWQGDINTTHSYTLDDELYGSTGLNQSSGSINYKGLHLQTPGGSANGNYEADSLDVNVTRKTYGCDPRRLTQTTTSIHTGPYDDELSGPEHNQVVKLESRESGFYFGAWHFFIDGDYESTGCFGDTQEGTFRMGVFDSPINPASFRITQDTDPDPYRLVGTTHSSMASNPPESGLYATTTAYQYSFTYDLTLVPTSVPTSCDDSSVTQRHYTTIDGVASLDAALGPDPDFATFSMGIKWCVTPPGSVIISQTNPYASLSGNWIFLGVLDNFGLKPYSTRASSAVAGNRALGQATFGVQTSAAKFAASFVPTGRLFKALNKAGKRFAKYRKLVGKGKAFQVFRRAVHREVERWGREFKRNLIKEIDKLPGVRHKYAEALGGLIADKVLGKIYGLEKQFTGAPDQGVEKLFGKVFKDVKVPLWTVNAGVRVFSDGTHQFINASSSPLLKEEWEHETAG